MSRAKLPVPPGQIGGYVVDPSGAVVANARITLIPSKAGQNATAVTNSQGLWLIAGVPTGTYKAQAEAPGFRTAMVSVNYDANQPAMYSFTLNVGSVAETVEVAAQNGQIQNGQVPTDTAAIVADRDIRQIPINSRSSSELATLSPGPLWTISSTGTLRRSADQGKTWQDVDVTTNPTASASVAVTAQVSPVKARQADKGLKHQPPSPTFRTVAAAGAHVWAGGSGGALYHSADAGSHWTRVDPTSPAWNFPTHSTESSRLLPLKSGPPATAAKPGRSNKCSTWSPGRPRPRGGSFSTAGGRKHPPLHHAFELLRSAPKLALLSLSYQSDVYTT
jgi:hypothetical protein